MTRLILITLLVLNSGLAFAEWVLLGQSGSGTSVYADPDTIRRKGDVVKMWYLFDFRTVRTVEGSSFSSSTYQSEFDCVEERRRLLAYTLFSGNMKNGQAVYNYSGEDNWVPVQPGSIEQALWKVACGKQ